MATGQTSWPWNELCLFCTHNFSYWWTSLIVISQPQPGEEPYACRHPLFDLIWFVAYRAKWRETLLSWLSRNKPYQIRHIGLSVLAHTIGINWSSNTTDKSIPSFPPVSSPANWTLRLLIHAPHSANGRSPELDWQRYRREPEKKVREKESIRKPLATGVRVWVSNPQRARTCTEVERSRKQVEHRCDCWAI